MVHRVYLLFCVLAYIERMYRRGCLGLGGAYARITATLFDLVYPRRVLLNPPLVTVREI